MMRELRLDEFRGSFLDDKLAVYEALVRRCGGGLPTSAYRSVATGLPFSPKPIIIRRMNTRNYWGATERGALLITAAFFMLALLYSVITPIFEAPDEPEHYRYIHRLATTRTLPIVVVNNLPLGAEIYQQPLYYMLAAIPTALAIPPNDEYNLPRNPHASLGKPAAFSNKNVLYHADDERLPYRDTALAVHLIRLLSIFMGTLTVWITFLTAREIFPHRPWLVWGALTIIAFNPQFIYISGAISNDNAVVLTSALTVFLLIRIMRRGVSAQYLTALGVTLGLALLTKTTAFALLPLTALVLTITAWRERKLSQLPMWGGALALLGSAIAGWWYWRNWRLYGDPLATRLARAIFQAHVHPPSAAQIISEIRGAEISFWAVFGSMNITVHEWFYIFVKMLTRAGIFGIAVFVVKRVRRKSFRLRHLQLLMLVAWVLLNLVALIRLMLVVRAALQGRLLFPALPAIAILLFWGITQLLPQQGIRLAALFIGTIMFVSALLFPFRYIVPVYARPAPLSATEIAAIPHPLDVNFADKIRLRGYTLPHTAEPVYPGDAVSVTLYWEALADVETSYSVFIHLLDEYDLIIAQADSAPGRGNYPTHLWRVGEVIADEHRILVPDTAFAPFQGHFAVGLYDFTTGTRLPAAGSAPDHARFGDIAITRRESAHSGNPIAGNFANQIALVGYDLDTRRARPGETILLTLYWQATAPMDTDYTVFTHILGEREYIAGQHDSPPQRGAAPTSAWLRGEIIRDEHPLVIAPNAPAGAYTVEVGLYVVGTGQRLPRVDDRGQYADTRVLLGKVRITEEN